MSVARDQKPINAQNYAHGGAPVPISVVLEQRRAPSPAYRRGQGEGT